MILLANFGGNQAFTNSNLPIVRLEDLIWPAKNTTSLDILGLRNVFMRQSTRYSTNTPLLLRGTHDFPHVRSTSISVTQWWTCHPA